MKPDHGAAALTAGVQPRLIRGERIQTGLAVKLREATGRLLKLVKEVAKVVGVKPRPRQPESVTPSRSLKAKDQAMTFPQLRGRIRKTVTDVLKNERDLPRLAEHHFDAVTPTAAELDSALISLRQIRLAASRVVRFVPGSKKSKIKAGDRLDDRVRAGPKARPRPSSETNRS